MHKAFILLLALFFMFPANFLRAEEGQSSTSAFSVEPSKEWEALPLSLQGVVASYRKNGTLATFHIREQDIEQAKTLDQLKWADLFSPQFAEIDIHKEGMTTLAGEKARFCIYSLKPGEFKTTMEGKIPGKYINYVLIHRGKLFSITFMDTEDGFALNYPSFLSTIRTLRFDVKQPQTLRRNT